MPPPLPALPRHLRADLFAANIARDPTTVTFRGAPLTVRLSQPSLRRQLEVEGARQQTANLEAMMRLPCGADRPQEEKEHLLVNGISYRIILVQIDPGADCYICTLARHNQ